MNAHELILGHVLHGRAWRNLVLVLMLVLGTKSFGNGLHCWHLRGHENDRTRCVALVDGCCMHGDGGGEYLCLALSIGKAKHMDCIPHKAALIIHLGNKATRFVLFPDQWSALLDFDTYPAAASCQPHTISAQDHSLNFPLLVLEFYIIFAVAF